MAACPALVRLSPAVIVISFLMSQNEFAPSQPGSIAITGASGLLGTALCHALTKDNQDVISLRRGEASPGSATWNPSTGEIHAGKPLRAIVHLAGESVVGRWTPAKKQRIRDSRVGPTRKLSEEIAKMANPPEVLLSASAIGIYGERGDEIVNEHSEPGPGFLPEVCREWEEATAPAVDAGVRVVHLRIGIVLSSKGGALAKTLLPFKLGLGGPVGNGRQWMSWISLCDAISAMEHALQNDRIEGAMNLVAPHAVTNKEFTKSLGKALRRPAILPVLGPLVKVAFGEMGKELVLCSTRVEPAWLWTSGYQFKHPNLDGALHYALHEEK